MLFSSIKFADSTVRAALVQVIPDIFARCIELGTPELEYFLFNRMLEILLRFLKNEENMVSRKTMSLLITFNLDLNSFQNLFDLYLI